MSEDKSSKQRKRPLNSEERETSSKKRRDESKSSTVAVNSLDIQKVKKAPRLSPALFCDKCEIHHGHLHQLLKYAVLGKESSAAQASWCSIHHQKRLRGVVVIVLQDLGQHHFYQFYLHFRCLRRLFRHRFSLPPPPCDFIASLVGLNCYDVTSQNQVEIDSNDLHNGTQGHQHCNSSDAARPILSHDLILRKYGNKRHGLTRYLLSEEEMRKNDYPSVGCSDTENFVHTNCTGEATDSSPLFGLDCEMCVTSNGDEVTRVSLVDASGHCIMDELVKPDNPIRDYKTRFSGITRKMLLPVKTKLKDVQCKLKRLLPPNAVLVGHSLDNDLRALQMIHPNVIDTSLLFARSLGRRFRLKFLTQAVLKREIQCEDRLGHDPSEDAIAALNLAQYFIQHGPEEVVHLNLEAIFLEANNLQSPLADRDKNSEIKQNGFTHPPPPEQPGLVESLEKVGRKIVYVAKTGSVKSLVPPATFQDILCTSDEDVLERACSGVPLSPVSIVKFHPGNSLIECSVETNEQVRCKFAEMMTVFAGPFKRGLSLKSVKMHFQSCGPIHSLSIVSDTCQPYVCIKYSVLEAAQLAVELLDGTYIDGCCIKVQRLITTRTLDYQDIVKEMEEDPENKDTIYVSGFVKPLTEEFLQQQFSHFKEIKAIYVPTNPRSQRLAKYCYLKFLSPGSAAAATDYIRAHGGLRSIKAVTSSHLHHWLQAAITCTASHKQSNRPSEEDRTKKIKDVDRKINQLYESLLENTLCVILFPGNNSANGSLPGFGLMGIKTDQINLTSIF